MSVRVTKYVDRRPWLIISRKEAIALQEAAFGRIARGESAADLARALRVIDRQLRWIDDWLIKEGEPSVGDAVARDGAA